MSDRLRYFIVVAAIVVGICASYGLAQLGEPQSAWLWSHII
jgi:hypothetical protein